MTDNRQIDRPDRPSLEPEDWQEFRTAAHRMLDEAIDFMQDVRQRPVWREVPKTVKEQFQVKVPMDGQSLEQVNQDVLNIILPYAVGNIHPSFFGWVHGSGMPSAIIPEMIATAMNANVGGRDHGAVYVEKQIIEWCRQLFDFPDTASGLIVSGTSMATLIALTVARFAKSENDVRNKGVRRQEHLVGYASSETHTCIARSFDQIGLGHDNLREVPVNEAFEIDLNALRQMVKDDLARGYKPFCIIGNAATVNTGATDDLNALADLCAEHDLWFHIDGAFGAVAAMSETLKPRFKGIERADSIAFDFHKWMHVPYDAGFVLIRDEEQHRGAYSMRPDYLKGQDRGLAAANPWFCEYGPELSRGFRALKIWYLLKEKGVRAILDKVEDNCSQARWLADIVDSHPQLTLRAPVNLNIVCFQYKASDNEDFINQEIVLRLQEQGIAVPSTTKIAGQTVIRVNLTNHRTTRLDLERFIDAVVRIGRDILSE